jgi:RNA polymerase sigma factor FliA
MTKGDPAALKQWWLNYRDHQDDQAREQLITHYLYLVKYAVGRMLVHLPAHLEADDLTGYGLMGLIQAVEKFELARNIRFETFAMQRIRGAILDQLRALDWLPRSLRKKAKAIEKAIQSIEQNTGTNASEADIAAALAIDKETLQLWLSETSFLMLSFDYVFSPQENEGNTFGDTLADLAPGPAEQAQKNILRESLAQALRHLPEREQQLVSLYYFEGLTLKEIGQVLNVSEARVCQLHAKALHQLRSRLQ